MELQAFDSTPCPSRATARKGGKRRCGPLHFGRTGRDGVKQSAPLKTFCSTRLRSPTTSRLKYCDIAGTIGHDNESFIPRSRRFHSSILRSILALGQPILLLMLPHKRITSIYRKALWPSHLFSRSSQTFISLSDCSRLAYGILTALISSSNDLRGPQSVVRIPYPHSFGPTRRRWDTAKGTLEGHSC